MKLSKYVWDLYKQSENGKNTIDFFEYYNVFAANGLKKEPMKA